jgi:hypothetical protein
MWRFRDNGFPKSFDYTEEYQLKLRRSRRKTWNSEFAKVSVWARMATVKQQQLKEEQEHIDKRLALAMAFHTRLGEDSHLGLLADVRELIVPTI